MITYVASAGPSKEEGKGGYNYDRNLCNGEIKSKKIQFFQDLITRSKQLPFTSIVSRRFHWQFYF